MRQQLQSPLSPNAKIFDRRCQLWHREDFYRCCWRSPRSAVVHVCFELTYIAQQILTERGTALTSTRASDVSDFRQQHLVATDDLAQVKGTRFCAVHATDLICL